MEEEIIQNGELTRNMNIVAENMIFYLQKKNIKEIKSVNDIICLLPKIITNIELLISSVKGQDKKDVCKGVISIVIQRLVKDEQLEQEILSFLNNNSDAVIDNFVYMANYAGKVFNKKSCFSCKKVIKK